MTLRTVLLAAVATAFIAGPALARVPVVAKLEAPVAEKTRVIANGVVWRCEGDTCTGVMQRQVSVRTCGELAEEVGRLASFGSTERQVTGDDLTNCNTDAKQLPATTTAAAQ